MFEGQVDASKQVNLLYDDVERNYHLIINLTGAMAKSYVCKAGNKSCRSEITHVCDPSCSDCMTCPPCAFSDLRIPCEECNRHLRIRACFANHRVRQREIPYANVNFVAQLAECSWRLTVMNVISDIVLTVSRIEKYRVNEKSPYTQKIRTSDSVYVYKSQRSTQYSVKW